MQCVGEARIDLERPVRLHWCGNVMGDHDVRWMAGEVQGNGQILEIGEAAFINEITDNLNVDCRGKAFMVTSEILA